MTEETKSQAKYVPPRVMRLGEVRAGAGQCSLPGSGDATMCDTGNVAGTDCWGVGNGAIACVPGDLAGWPCTAGTGVFLCTPTGSGVV